MTVSTISTGLDNFVTLGSGNYALDLTIADTGAVVPSFDAFTIATGYSFAVNLDTSSAMLTNDGVIIGDTIQPGNPFAAGGGVSLCVGIVLNNGSITGGASSDEGGVGLYQTGGSFTNFGEIIGGAGGRFGGGVGLFMTGGTAVNYGVLEGGMSTLVGVNSVADGALIDDGTLVNDNVIVQAYVAGNGTLINYDTIESALSGHVAAMLGQNGVLINKGNIVFTADGLAGEQNYGVSLRSNLSPTISAALVNEGGIFGGVNAVFGGTVNDAGFIASAYTGGDAITFGQGNADLILDPGATFLGSVVATPSFENGQNTIVNHTFVPVTIFNSNVLELAAGSAVGTIDMGGSFVGFNTIDFAPGAAWELAGTTAELAAGQTISGFIRGDDLRLDNFAATSDTYVPGAGLIVSNGTSSDTLNITGSFATNDFSVTEGGGQTKIEFAPCFAAGTRILTAAGDVAVERLAVGAKVITRGGGEAAAVWIGRRQIDLRRHRRPEAVQPVRIAADAFGEGVPVRDLVLSPDHAVFLQGRLIPVKALINGLNVCRLQREAVVYYHVELPAHDVIFAERLAVESYLDTGNRSQFENGGAALALHPDFEQAQREQQSCAPFTESGPFVEAARQRLCGRSTRRKPARYEVGFTTNAM